MNGSELKRLYAIPYMAMLKNIDGVGDAESRRAPAGGGNSINWVVGHVLAIRAFAHRQLGIPPVWTDEEAKPYARGADPSSDGRELKPFETVLADFARSQKMLEAALESATVEQLATPVEPRPPFMSKNVAEVLSALSFHEGYHIGQTGLLRRMLGKAGAIR